MNVCRRLNGKAVDESVAVITETGRVMVLKSGKAVITATVTDSNYASGISATFELDVSAKNVTLTPQNLVLTYNGKEQGITFSSDTGEFIPVLEGPDKNIDIKYTLKTDHLLQNRKNAGEYTVTYNITDPSFTAAGAVQLNINKAAAQIKANDSEKVYGEENPEYTFTGLLEEDMQDPAYTEKIKEMFFVHQWSRQCRR